MLLFERFCFVSFFVTISIFFSFSLSLSLSLSRFFYQRETWSTCSGCHAGWPPSPPAAICFSLSRRQGRLERSLVRGWLHTHTKTQSGREAISSIMEIRSRGCRGLERKHVDHWANAYFTRDDETRSYYVIIILDRRHRRR